MMKKTLIFVAAIAVMTSGAMAASLTLIPGTSSGGGASYLVGSMSPDGAYVGIAVDTLHTNGNTYAWPNVYDVGAAANIELPIKSGSAVVRGVASYGGNIIAVRNEADNVNTASWSTGTSASGSKGSLMTGNNSTFGTIGSANALAIDASGNGWAVGGTYNGTKGLAWQITAGAFDSTANWERKGVSTTKLNSVSATGIAVGNDRHARGGTTDGPILVNVGADGSPWAINAFGLDDKGHGEGISSNGMWASGYFQDAATDDPLHGFRNDVRRNITEELMPALYNASEYQLSYSQDVSDGGIAVGYTYNPDQDFYTSYHATVWFAGDTQGQLLQLILNQNGVDTSAWSKLERCIAISDDGLTIAGRGILAADGSSQAFICTIPEPATMSFLALGGLALLRRRR